jgi:hypothetical protein
LDCEPADDLILSPLMESSPYVAETPENRAQFAANRRRTLCCAYREFDDAVHQKWNYQFQAAICAIVEREKAIGDVMTLSSRS